jgi:putative tryptophan/tyrosine transport system substrate-binding protein
MTAVGTKLPYPLCLLSGRYRGQTEHGARSPFRSRLTQLGHPTAWTCTEKLLTLGLRAWGAGLAMKRREFITLLGGAAAVWQMAVRAQNPSKLPTIGFLGAATPAVASQWVNAFVKRLAELGWIEGRTVAIEYRWADARAERYAEIAAEFVGLKVDVIVTWASAPVLAAKQATTLVPIVFAAQMDPVGAGVVTSLARPGGNVTGMSIQQTDTAGKRLELLREAVPSLRRLAILGNVGAPGAVLEMNELDATARTLGLEVTKREIRQAEEIAAAVEALKGRVDALYVATDPLVFNNRIPINVLAQDARLPTICMNPNAQPTRAKSWRKYVNEQT